MSRFVARIAGTALAILIASPPLLSQPFRRVGAEFQVNSHTNDSQRVYAAAMGASGDFVVVWRSSAQDGSLYGVFARRFNAAGVPQAAEFQVNSHTASNQTYPTVAMDADGDFVVVWQSHGQDGDSAGIFARRFNAAGIAQAAEFQVNSFTPIDQSFPAVAMNADGDFVVAWQSYGQDDSSYGVFARRFDPAGVAQADELQINSYTPGNQQAPAVAMEAGGDFVAAWGSSGQDGSGNGVFARRFDAAGVAQGDEFLVNSYTTNAQFLPDVAVDADGNFAIAWQSFGQDGSTNGVFARRFNAAGGAETAEIQVNSHTTGTQSSPEVAMDADGDFFVAWRSDLQDGSGSGVFARRFDPAGVAQATEFQVNSHTTLAQSGPAVAMNAGGDFVVAWSSGGQDGSDYGVFAQRYAALGVLDIDGNGTVGALTDGLLVLRFLFGLSAAPLVSGAIDAVGCTRCNAPAIEAHLASLPLISRQLIRLGAEFQVNSYTPFDQSGAAVAIDADGDFVVAWNSPSDGSQAGVFARRFNAAGIAQAAELQVNSYTLSDQSRAAVAIDADGDFVVAWDSRGQEGDPFSYGVFARRFNAAGTAQAAELQVNSYTPGNQQTPAVAMDAGGGFVVAWTSYSQDVSSGGVFTRRFDAAGVAQAAELQVNSFTANSQYNPAVAMDAGGDFVVAWASSGQDGSSFGVFARRFDAAGVAQAAELQVNSFTSSSQFSPSVALDSDGDFVVVWSSLGQDGDSAGVFARRFDAAGVAQAAEFQVNSYTTDAQERPAVAMDAGGNFVVAWASSGQDDPSGGVFARRFDAAGVAQAAELQVNSYTPGSQSGADVAMNANGNFVVAWRSSGQDGSGSGVFAQRFAALSLLDVDGNGALGALTDGLLIVRHLFGLTGNPLVSGAIDVVGCTRCNAPSIEAYLATLM